MSEITISTGHPEAGRIYAEALDRVTAERDAALAELKTQTLRADAAVGDANEAEHKFSEVRELHSKQTCVFCNDTGNLRAVNDALQQRLTAADERADVLDGLLRLARQFVTNGVELGYITMPDPETPDAAHDLVPMIDAALKPAEGRNEPNCLLCLDKKTVPSNLAEGYVMDCPDCCCEEG